MPAMRFGSGDFLEYDGRYGVLICRECQYAIQKSALQSHLLRHKIYRGERQRLLSSIAQLDIFEPDLVPLPAPSSPPIDALAIISGYRCTATGCGNLCASFKRMRRHWSDVHGFSDSVLSLSSLAHPVKLQTFFRGTKIRYFEVSSLSTIDSTGTTPLPIITTENNYDEQEHEVDITASPPRMRTPSATPTRHFRPFLANIDLETLTYFHHFTNSTSVTLPNPKHLQSTMHYWQSAVVLQALRRRWLMCGLLAISASHLAFLAGDMANKRVHQDKFDQFFSDFSAENDESSEPGFDSVTQVVEENSQKIDSQMTCIIHCAHWSLADSAFDQTVSSEPVATFQLLSLMAIIRDSVIANLALRHSIVQYNEDDNQPEASALERDGTPDVRTPSGAESLATSSVSRSTPSVILKLLRALPYRMAETFGKPDNAQDVMATLSAIATLVESCNASFASDDIEAAWQGMATFLVKVPHRFNHMVSCHSPAALVVLAHWAALLVKRAVICGCWFMNGLPEMILRQIANYLPKDDAAIHTLVASLMP